MHQTGFSSAAFVSQSKATELCSSAAVVRPQSKFTELCSSAAFDQITGKVIDVSCTHVPLKALTGLVRSLNSDMKALKTVNSM